MASAIIVDEMGPELEYHLGTNREEAERIFALSPGRQIMELGMLKAKLMAAKSAGTVTRALKPIVPQGGNTTLVPAVDKLPMADYAAKRNADLADERKKGARR